MFNVLFGARPQQVKRQTTTDGFQRNQSSAPAFGRALKQDTFVRFGSTATSPDPQQTGLNEAQLKTLSDEKSNKKALEGFRNFAKKQLNDHIQELIEDPEIIALLTGKLEISDEEAQQKLKALIENLVKPLHDIEQVETAAHQATLEQLRANRTDDQLSTKEKKALAQQQELFRQKMEFLGQLDQEAQSRFDSAVLKKLNNAENHASAPEGASAQEAAEAAISQAVQNKIINDPEFVQDVNDWAENFESGAHEKLIVILSDPEWLEAHAGIRKPNEKAEKAKVAEVNKALTAHRQEHVDALNKEQEEKLKEIFNGEVPDKIHLTELSPEQQEAYIRLQLKMSNLQRYLDKEFNPHALFMTVAQGLIEFASQAIWAPMNQALNQMKGDNPALNKMIALAQSDEPSERLQGLNDLLLHLARSRTIKSKQQLVKLIQLTSEVPTKELKQEALELLTTLKDDKIKTDVLHLFLSSESRSNQLAALRLVTLNESPISAETYRLIGQSATLKNDIETLRQELQQVPKDQRTEETVTLRQLLNQVDHHNAKQTEREQAYAAGRPKSSGVFGFPVFDD